MIEYFLVAIIALGISFAIYEEIWTWSLVKKYSIRHVLIIFAVLLLIFEFGYIFLKNRPVESPNNNTYKSDYAPTLQELKTRECWHYPCWIYVPTTAQIIKSSYQLTDNPKVIAADKRDRTEVQIFDINNVSHTIWIGSAYLEFDNRDSQGEPFEHLKLVTLPKSKTVIITDTRQVYAGFEAVDFYGNNVKEQFAYLNLSGQYFDDIIESPDGKYIIFVTRSEAGHYPERHLYLYEIVKNNVKEIIRSDDYSSYYPILGKFDESGKILNIQEFYGAEGIEGIFEDWQLNLENLSYERVK